MYKLKAFIADDEHLDRRLLKDLIRQYCTHIEVLAEAATVQEAVPVIEKLQPDVIFLDIQMRGETGFDLLEQVTLHPDTKIVFTTGYDQYGIKAVKAGAFDYLLKPIAVDELEQLEQKLLAARQQQKLQIKFPHKGEQLLLPASAVAYIRASGSYITLFTGDGRSYTIAKNLKQFQALLPSGLFIQVHRSVAVNRDYIRGIRSAGNSATLTLNDGVKLPVSRSYKEQLQKEISI
jgi:two-component system, LytTR family, response regulator